jgi:hypothetical protein
LRLNDGSCRRGKLAVSGAIEAYNPPRGVLTQLRRGLSPHLSDSREEAVAAVQSFDTGVP